jgi:hypothetical protein
VEQKKVENLYRIRLNSPESLAANAPYYLLVSEPATDNTPEMKEEIFPESQAKELRDEYVRLFKPDYSVDLEEFNPLAEGTHYVEWSK